MNQLTYYEVHRSEINNRVLLNETIRTNEEKRQQREFVEKNRFFNRK